MKTSVFEAVAADVRGRDAVGRRSHGGRALDPFERDRDWLQEAYEEALDLAVYQRASLERWGRLLRAVGCLDEYIGAAGDPAVARLGAVSVPIWMLQDLRSALRGDGR